MWGRRPGERRPRSRRRDTRGVVERIIRGPGTRRRRKKRRRSDKNPSPINVFAITVAAENTWIAIAPAVEAFVVTGLVRPLVGVIAEMGNASGMEGDNVRASIGRRCACVRLEKWMILEPVTRPPLVRLRIRAIWWTYWMQKICPSCPWMSLVLDWTIRPNNRGRGLLPTHPRWKI